MLSSLQKQGSRAKQWIPAYAGMTNTVLPFPFLLCFLPGAKKAAPHNWSYLRF
jgi:hypothetical protein